jgi:hypothetical protein
MKSSGSELCPYEVLPLVVRGTCDLNFGDDASVQKQKGDKANDNTHDRNT